MSRFAGGASADDRTGFFSEVWRGSWQGIPVAIKQLDPMADKKVICSLLLWLTADQTAFHQGSGRLASTPKPVYLAILWGVQHNWTATVDVDVSIQ